MSYFALFFLLFGGIIIAYPEFLAYLIGYFFICIGLNSLFFSLALSRKRSHGEPTSSWSVGGYELIKKRK